MNKKCFVYIYDANEISLEKLNFSTFPRSVVSYLDSKKKNPKFFQSQIAWYYLCKVLDEEFKYDLTKLVFSLEKHKKPRIEGVHFSISHSNDLIAFCVGNSPCSIDIELMKARDFSKLTKKLTEIPMDVTQPESFYRKWCAGECLFKLGEEEKNYTLSFYETKDLNLNAYMLCVCSNDALEIKSSLTTTRC
jgi:phosphopantetheinyl transferase